MHQHAQGPRGLDVPGSMTISADTLRASGVTDDAVLLDSLVHWLEEQEIECMSDLRMVGPLARLEGMILFHMIKDILPRLSCFQAHKTCQLE